jgi:hypothetical protein
MTQPDPPPHDPALWETDPATGKLRRRAAATVQEQTPGEQNGPKGLEPTRYGDWERKGLISDF